MTVIGNPVWYVGNPVGSANTTALPRLGQPTSKDITVSRLTDRLPIVKHGVP